MSSVQVPSTFILSKIKTHTGESVPTIITRKQDEVANTGRAFWGYGGTTCHPLTQVKPFADTYFGPRGSIPFLMERIAGAPHVPSPADKTNSEYSTDKKVWIPLPKDIEVIGTRYALILGSITTVDIDLDLSDYEVAVGVSQGALASQYLRNQVSKGCFTKSGAQETYSEPDIHHITFMASVIPPYAVFVR